MQANIQYELFESNDDIAIVQKEIIELRVAQNNLRKGLFARHNDLSRLYMRQQEEIERLKVKVHSLSK